jgi:hypothetical protein
MEKRDAALLIVTSTIVHDVPKHKKDDTSGQVEYSERESDLNGDLKLFFKDKVSEAIGGKGFKIVFDATFSSPVPTLIKNIIDGRSPSFIDSSKEISKHLYDIQKGWNPAGIVVVIKGQVNRKKVAVIMKLERDEGARLKKHSREHYIDIESVRDLMLTKKTKLFKVGLFFDRADFNTDFDGYVCDNQISLESTAVVARFFLEQFLGCQLYDDMRKLTRQFFEATKEYILRVEDPIRKAKYYEHLLSYMNRPLRTIDPRDFAVNHFEQQDRHDYEEHLVRNNMQVAPFEKDTELVKAHITKMMIDFENDVSIISRNGELGNRVILTDEGGGITKAEVRSKIKKIGS